MTRRTPKKFRSTRSVRPWTPGAPSPRAAWRRGRAQAERPRAGGVVQRPGTATSERTADASPAPARGRGRRPWRRRPRAARRRRAAVRVKRPRCRAAHPEAPRRQAPRAPARASDRARRGRAPRILHDAREHRGGHERVEEAPTHPAEGEPEIELRESAFVGPIGGQPRVAHQRREEERREVHEGRRDGLEHQRDHRDAQGEREPVVGAEERRATAPRERDDEAHQVEQERQRPEERDGRDVRRDVRGHAHQVERGHEREREPEGAALPRDRRLRGGRTAPRRERWRARRHDGAERAEPGEDGVGHVPCAGLRAEPEEGLDHHGVRRERHDAAQVARRVEAVCVAAAERGEPPLKARRARRQDEERRADGRRQQPEEAQRRGSHVRRPRRDASADTAIGSEERRTSSATQHRLPARAEPPQRQCAWHVPRSRSA